MSATQRHIVLVTPDPQWNSLGRTYCLWLLAEHLGWRTTLVSLDGAKIWEPLRDTEFGRGCVAIDRADPGWPAALTAILAAADVVIAVKPLASTLGAVHEVARAARVPLIVDVDDPDVEVRTVWRPLRERIPRRLMQPTYRERVRLGKLARALPTLVSNPILQQIYGGAIVPHVRASAPAMPHRETEHPIIRFVGSPKAHKGVDILRAAVERLADEGYTLEITASAPADAKPWEAWLGNTTFTEGQRLAATADIIVIPSLPTGWAPAQLPAKLMDAMMFGRPVVASDLPPISWALGSTGITVAAGDVDALVAALRGLRGLSAREALGSAAHERALAMFSVEAVAPILSKAVEDLMTTASAARTTSAQPG